MDIFKLSPLEKRQIKNDVNQLVSELLIPISYYEEEDWNPNSGGTGGEWSNYENYSCGKKLVSKININRFAYGDIKEGDMVLYLPAHTGLPKVQQYKFKYHNIKYHSNSGLIPRANMGDELLYYMMVGER